MVTLRLKHWSDRGPHLVEVTLEGLGAPRTATTQFAFDLTAQDREDMRWYLEDYLLYPVAPTPEIAHRVEDRLNELGGELFTAVFRSDPETRELWDALAGSLPDVRVEIAAGYEGSAVPWELMRDPDADEALALRADAFVRIHTGAVRPQPAPGTAGNVLRVLLVICRPGGAADVPFRSVASQLVRLGRTARDAFQLSVLRPPTFAQLSRVLKAAQACGTPYHVVHFDGHGIYLDEDDATAAITRDRQPHGSSRFSFASPPRPGSHGYLVFEDPGTDGGQQLVDGPAIGKLLADAGVPVLVLNACRSAHADLTPMPTTGGEANDADQRIRAYGSLAQEVMETGAVGVVAMRYNVYVVTAARFIGDVYAGLLAGRELGVAVSVARKRLAASSSWPVGNAPWPLQDWLVPVVYQAAPVTLLAPAGEPEREIAGSDEEAGAERAYMGPVPPEMSAAGFVGRDETLLTLDRAFDTGPVVLLHAWSGAGKTATVLEFARWYALTGAVDAVLFTPFTQYVPLARLLDQVADRFGPILENMGVEWAASGDSRRRDCVLGVLARTPLLWVWDNVEPVTGFPDGAPSAWTAAEREDIASFLGDLARHTRCKVLLTSRRQEQEWLGYLPRRVGMPAMSMLERQQLARAVAARQPGGEDRFLEVEDWRPLLDFSQGNPLTVMILVRHALRNGVTSREQVEEFVAALRAGAARVTDDVAQGRDASLAASLDYGFTGAFTDHERAVLALLALFQGFTDVDVLCSMGTGLISGGPVQMVANLTRGAATALLDRAAEAGLLAPVGDGYYGVHPAVPLHLQNLFEQYYGPADGELAFTTLLAWAASVSYVGHQHANEHQDGHPEVIRTLEWEEANLLRARQIWLARGWNTLAVIPMVGISVLYGETGRAAEWRRLVEDMASILTDLATEGPLPDHESLRSQLAGWRTEIARSDRDWPTAERLQNSLIEWHRNRAAEAIKTLTEALDEVQCSQLGSLAVALGNLARILADQQDPRCIQPYLEAAALCERIGDRRVEASVASGLGTAYKDIPDLRDLNQAERWYRRAWDLHGQADTKDRAIILGQIGAIAYERFKDARSAGLDQKVLIRNLNAAARAYQLELQLLPPGAFEDHAVAQNMLGNVYAAVPDIDTAMNHYLKAIQYRELLDDVYGAGVIRYNAAITLEESGRPVEALLYAAAAMRDFDRVGPGAAEAANRVRELMTALQEAEA